MKSDWKKVKLGDIIILKNGKSRPVTGNKYPVYGGNGILGYSDSANEKNIIVIGRVGAYCGATYIENGELWLSDNAIGIENNQMSDLDFLYYFLKSTNLNKMAIGGAQPLLTQGILKDIELYLPPLPIQQSIAKVLSSLDDKIENLQKQNKVLENIAQTLFKRWFVDFEFPDEKGNPYKSSGGKMVESGLGLIPEGWRVGRYSDLVEVVTGKGIKKEELDSKGIYPVIGANGEIGKTNIHLFDEDLILTGRVGTLGTVFFSSGRVWVSDNVLISRPLHQHNYYISFFYLKSLNFQSLNRGSTQPLITQTDLKNTRIVLPESKSLQAYHEFVSTLFSSIQNNKRKIEALKHMRDMLLPKLMKGEIEI